MLIISLRKRRGVRRIVDAKATQFVKTQLELSFWLQCPVSEDSSVANSQSIIAHPYTLK